MKGGKISLTCSNKCFKLWDAAGRNYPPRKCQACGQEDDHTVLQCKHITEKVKARMKKEIGYTDDYAFWHNVNNIAKARRLIFNTVVPQYAITDERMPHDERTYGTATIGPIERDIYFDLGGVHDLMDLDAYDEIVELIDSGDMAKAKIINPIDMGYSKRGVPIDVAAATDEDGTSVLWIQKWIRLTANVRTHAGRRIELTQLCVGFVPRSTPLFILGKETCAICGYRTIRQQDADRRHDRDDKHKKPKCPEVKRECCHAEMRRSSNGSDSTTDTNASKDSTTRTKKMKPQYMTNVPTTNRNDSQRTY